ARQGVGDPRRPRGRAPEPAGPGGRHRAASRHGASPGQRPRGAPPGAAHRGRPLRARRPSDQGLAGRGGPAGARPPAGRDGGERAALRAPSRSPGLPRLAGVPPQPAHHRAGGRGPADGRRVGGQGAQRPTGRAPQGLGGERRGARGRCGVGQRTGARWGSGGGRSVGVRARGADVALAGQALRQGRVGRGARHRVPPL
ncbi:MAG: Transcriptional regulator, IclR family, partial [uncultured Acidimicrobiales bacterium]